MVRRKAVVDLLERKAPHRNIQEALLSMDAETLKQEIESCRDGMFDAANQRWRLRNNQLRQQVEIAAASREIIGSSAQITSVKARIAKFAPSESTVLILGETGVGKELVARAIHFASLRAGKAFVAINCAAVTETLLESEFFGHE